MRKLDLSADNFPKFRSGDWISECALRRRLEAVGAYLDLEGNVVFPREPKRKELDL